MTNRERFTNFKIIVTKWAKKLLQSATGITNQGKIYLKLWQVLQSVTRDYYKVCQVLPSVTIITKFL